MSEVAYRPLTIAEQIFKQLIWDSVLLGGEKALEVYAPFLALPVLSTIEEGTLNAVGDWLYSKLVLVIDIAAIQLVNTAHQAAWTSASVNLKVIAHDKGMDSPEFRKARDEAKIALAQFSHFGS